MDLSIIIMEKPDTVANILKFQTDGVSAYWREKLFRAYPFLDENLCAKLPWEARKQYLTDELSAFYDKITPQLQQKLIATQKVWATNKAAVNDTYSKVFNVDCCSILNDMVAGISLNPICPRFLKEKFFSVVWAGDDDNFLKTALHEMIHFVWFYVWQQHFADKAEEYEKPHLKWILSELVIDTLVKDTAIRNLYPEAHRQQPAYKYFYQMNINDTPILHTLSALNKQAKNIEEFMEISYKYCLENEASIRKEIQ